MKTLKGNRQMTNKQFQSIIKFIIGLIEAIIPDIPERKKLIQAIEEAMR